MTSTTNIEVQVETRPQGKHTSRYLRRNKRVPAVVYGPKIKNINFSLSELDATRYSKREFENAIFVLKSEEPHLNNLKVLKKHTDRHPAHRRPVHLDFYALDMTQSVKINVELRFEGTPEGVKGGGIAQENRRDIEIECQPSSIPDFFVVDVSNLNIGESLQVSDVALPEGVKLITSEEESIYSIGQPKAEKESPAEAASKGDSPEAASKAANPDDGQKKE